MLRDMRSIVAAIVAVALTACSKTDNAPTPTGSAAPSPEPPRATAPLPPRATSVDIKTLLAEYDDNEVRADSRYKGKFVETSGLVGEVKKDITGGTYVTLGTGQMLEIPVLQCSIAEGQESGAAGLTKGQRITVRATVDGLMMNVLASGCVINPVMQLCRRLKAALGATQCSVDPKTGDGSGLVGLDGVASGVVKCLTNTEKGAADAAYASTMASDLSRKDTMTLVGSERAACIGLFTVGEGKATRPVDGEQLAKIKAFFASL